MAKVFLGVPTHDGRIHNSIINSHLLAGKSLSKLAIDTESAFILCINRLLANALTDRKHGTTHFCLLHQDIQIHEQDWLDKMIWLMKQKDADVLSVVVPIKSNEGLTSTGIESGSADNPLGFSHRKLSLKEIHENYEPTFTDPMLLVNTGVMLVDIRKDWVEKIHFQFRDKIVRHPKDPKVFIPVTVSEDWGFSRDARALGAKLWATREIQVTHHGGGRFPNTWVKPLETQARLADGQDNHHN